MTDTVMDRRTVTPKPCARPRRIDLAPARPRSITSVAIAFADKKGPVFRYYAVSAEQTDWSGVVQADTVDAAVIDLVGQIRADAAGMGRVRFLIALPATSPLWRHAPEVGALLPGVSVEMPALADQDLMKAARTALLIDAPEPEPAPAPPPEEPPADLSPVWVATDGSVRRKFTGLGWLASNGGYGMLGFKHSTKQIGANVVLISELRAIGDAVRKLRGRDITLMSDSRLAVAMVKRWMDGEVVLPEGYTTERGDGKQAGLVQAQRLIHAQRERLTPMWMKGHRGEPLNEGADALARLASRFATGTSELTTDEYHRRAADLAKEFAKEFNRQRAGR